MGLFKITVVIDYSFKKCNILWDSPFRMHQQGHFFILFLISGHFFNISRRKKHIYSFYILMNNVIAE